MLKRVVQFSSFSGLGRGEKAEKAAEKAGEEADEKA